MGIYVFSAHALFEQLVQDAADETSSHDFGKDIIPKMIADGEAVYAHPFEDKNQKSRAYWRDVGTIDAYYQANMDLVSVDPELNLYDSSWPIRTAQSHLPPPKFVFADVGLPGVARRGIALDSLISPGCILSGGAVVHSILSPEVRVNSYALIEDSILLHNVSVGRHSRIRRAIVDKEVVIPPNTTLGHDREADQARGLTVTESGIVLVPKGAKIT
jgi:glucose-1-phosphate adenylyltransferase